MRAKLNQLQDNKALHPTAYSFAPSFVPHFVAALPAAGELGRSAVSAQLEGMRKSEKRKNQRTQLNCSATKYGRNQAYSYPLMQIEYSYIEIVACASHLSVAESKYFMATLGHNNRISLLVTVHPRYGR